MSLLFRCKCEFLLYKPATHPCGHTTCLHCAEENMVCVNCDYKLTEPPAINRIIQSCLLLWFKSEYESIKFKRMAIDFFQSKNFRDALRNINLSISLNKKDCSAYLLRSKIYTAKKLHKRALFDAEILCKLDSNSGKYQYQKGLCLSNVGDIDNAIDAFQMCLELNPLDKELSENVTEAIDNLLCPDDEKETKASVSECNDSDTDEGFEIEFPDDSTIENKKIDEILKDISNSSCNNDRDNGETIKGIPKHLITKEDFECRICFDILFKPLTVPCGHVFCSDCLIQTMDHNSSCPICRQSLAEYHSSSPKPETALIVDILQLCFKEQYDVKTKKLKDRMEYLSRVGVDENVEVPIFTCAIAFPYITYKLHIFEPKYRVMIREALESGSRKFGMCLPNIEGEIYDIGTICDIIHCQKFPDGRLLVETTATQRFLLENKISIGPLTYGKVTYFKDEPEEMESSQLRIMSVNVYDKMNKYYLSLSETEQVCVCNALGPLPPYQDDVLSKPHGLPWVWWGLAMIPVNQTAKLVLLRSKSVSGRMLSLQRFLQFLTRTAATTA